MSNIKSASQLVKTRQNNGVVICGAGNCGLHLKIVLLCSVLIARSHFCSWAPLRLWDILLCLLLTSLWGLSSLPLYAVSLGGGGASTLAFPSYPAMPVPILCI